MDAKPEAMEPAAGMMLCPACGYDLRGAPGDRCSECGEPFDRAAFDHSGFPWAYRKTVGIFKAFFKTVWLVTIDAKSIRYESARRQSPGDAAVFRRWVVLGVAIAAALFATLMQVGGAVSQMLLKKDTGGFGILSSSSGMELDLHLPWSAGMAIPGAPYAYAAIAGAYATTAMAGVFRTSSMAGDRADAVRAVGRYVAAPLLWLLPACVGYAAVFSYALRDVSSFKRSPLFAVLVWVCVLLAVVAVGAVIHRTGQWRARSLHAGFVTGFAAMGELVLRWALGIGLVIFVVPWCVGFLRVFIDSFRL